MHWRAQAKFRADRGREQPYSVGLAVGEEEAQRVVDQNELLAPGVEQARVHPLHAHCWRGGGVDAGPRAEGKLLRARGHVATILKQTSLLYNTSFRPRLSAAALPLFLPC